MKLHRSQKEAAGHLCWVRVFCLSTWHGAWARLLGTLSAAQPASCTDWDRDEDKWLLTNGHGRPAGATAGCACFPQHREQSVTFSNSTRSSVIQGWSAQKSRSR